MAAVTIVKGFTLTHDKVTAPDDPHMFGKDEYIPPGTHEMPDGMANHWFVLAHSDDPPPARPRAGTPEFGAAAAAAERRRKMVEAVIEQEAQQAAAAVKADALQSGRYVQNENEVHAELEEEEKRVAAERENEEATRTGRKPPSGGVSLPPRRGAATAPPAEPAA